MRWRELKKGQGNAVAVAIDLGAARRQASFVDMAPHLAADVTVLEPVWSAVLSERIPEADDVFSHWLDDLETTGMRVVGVLSYCAGAPLAARFSEVVAQRMHRRPICVLFDPGEVDTALLYSQFGAAVDTFAEALDDVEDGNVVATIRSVVEDTRKDADLPTLIRMMRSGYEEVVRFVSAKLMLGDDAVLEMSMRFAVSFNYYGLSAQVTDRSLFRPDQAITVISSAHHTPPAGLSPDIVIDVSSADLLADRRAIRAASSLVAAGIDRAQSSSP